MKTNGISPKLVLALISAEASYLLGQQVLELPAWGVLLLNLVLVGIAVAAASPGNVVPRRHTDSEAGYTLVEVAVGLILFAIFLAIIFRYVL